MISHLNKIKELQEQYDIKTYTLALQYVLQKDYIDYAVIGVDSPKQLLTNIKAISKPVLIPHKEIDNIIVHDKSLLNPSNWLI